MQIDKIYIDVGSGNGAYADVCHTLRSKVWLFNCDLKDSLFILVSVHSLTLFSCLFFNLLHSSSVYQCVGLQTPLIYPVLIREKEGVDPIIAEFHMALY